MIYFDYDFDQDLENEYDDDYQHICEKCEAPLNSQPDATQPGDEEYHFTCPACGYFR